MNVYRIQDPTSNEFFDNSSRMFTSNTGTIFFDFKQAKRSLRYYLSRCRRYYGYYSSDNEYDRISRERFQEGINKSSRSIIIEYKLVETTNRFSGDGIPIKSTVKEKEDTEIDYAAQLDRIDFSNN